MLVGREGGGAPHPGDDREGVRNPSFERTGSPFRGKIAVRSPPTFRRLIGGYGGTFCGKRSGRDKEVDVGASLTTRDGSRLRHWQVCLIALVLAMALGMIRSGASWGSSTYDPTTDPYSMQNVTAGDGVQAWWNGGYTGKGRRCRRHRHGVPPSCGP